MGNRGHNDSSSESDDWEDESWIVDCPCGVNFDDGEEMVECDECGVWVHTACCRVPKLLPTYVCDKCKFKEKQKEAESEVAQLLADLPSKTFEEKSVHRAEPFTAFRVPFNLPTEAKTHVTGIPGGDPSFFVGASKIFSRQLWTYSGYVPKKFNVDYHQLGDLCEGTAELLRDLPNVEVPSFIEEHMRLVARISANCRVARGNGQGSPKLQVESQIPVHEDVKVGRSPGEEGCMQGEAPKDKQLKDNNSKKSEVKHVKHRNKPKMKDEKGHLHVKRAREEGGLREHMSKKKLRITGDGAKTEDMQGRVLMSEDAPPTPLVPHLSPKNPKAMKKLAVQEFMDGVFRVCNSCGNIDLPVARAVFHVGGSSNVGTDWICQKCMRVGGSGTSATFVPETGNSKQDSEAVEQHVGMFFNMGDMVKNLPDKCDAAVKMPRIKEEIKQIPVEKDCSSSHLLPIKVPDDRDTSADLKTSDVDVKHTNRNRVRLEIMEVVNDKEPLPANLESPMKLTNRTDAEREAGEIFEALDSSEPRNITSFSGYRETGGMLASKANAGRCGVEQRPFALDELRSCALVNKTPGFDGSAADLQLERKGIKLLVTPASSEIRGQGSARTSGCLPASVREKFNQQQQRAGSVAVVPLCGSSGQSSGQASMSLTPIVATPTPAFPASGSVFARMSVGEDSGLLHAHAQVEEDGLVYGLRAEVGYIESASETTHEAALLPQSSGSALRLDADMAQRMKVQPAEAKEQNRTDSHPTSLSPKLPLPGSVGYVDVPEQKSSLPICQQARQSNGVGTYSRKPSVQTAGTTANLRMTTSNKSDNKVMVGGIKSPMSSGTSSSPTSPLVTTPSSKLQPHCGKAPGSPPSQKSLSGGTTPKSVNIPPQGASKLLSSGTFSSKQTGSLQTSKSVPSFSASPLAAKAVNLAKQSSRSSSLPVTKPGDVSTKPSSVVTSSRSGNHGSPSSGVLGKDNLKTVTQTSCKGSAAGKNMPQSSVAKPPSSSKHSHGPSKVGSVTGHPKQHSGSSKASLSQTSKATTVQHSKSASVSKEEKSSLPAASSVPKAVFTMPPPPPQIPTKRSPPAVLTGASSTTLKDEELALLLHQELNSSPRVPRVQRVRQVGASLQMASSTPTTVSVKGTVGTASGAGGSHKVTLEHHLALRRRTREDRPNVKDVERQNSKGCVEEKVKSGTRKLDDGKSEDGKSASEGLVVGHAILDTKDTGCTLGSDNTFDGNARRNTFGKGGLSIIVPDSEEGPDAEKKSPADGRVPSLSGLIDDVLNTQGYQTSYEDVCEAILPHWPKLRKPSGERYAYASHRQVIMDCLKSRPSWSHSDRGQKSLQTYTVRKRRRNETTMLSDSESDLIPNGLELLGNDGMASSKPLKRSKGSEGDGKGDDGGSSAQKNSGHLSKGKRTVRRRRRLAMDDGTDGEDEPRIRTETDAEMNKTTTPRGISQEEEPDSISSPSSEEAVSNYSEEDEEMVVHRGIRNRRRRGDESNGSEDDRD